MHISNEHVPLYTEAEASGVQSDFFMLEKMCFPEKDQNYTLLYNNKITVSNIPANVCNYVANGEICP